MLWIWNGSLERTNLLQQLKRFHAQGVAGALIRAGSGLRTAYLGPEWFEMVNACADEAARLGLKLWLADDERGPSGAAGGLATAELEHARKFLRLKIADAGFTWPQRSTFVKAWAARVDSFNFSDSTPLEYNAAAPTDGRHVLLFTTGTCRAETIHNDHPPLDLLSPEATAHFRSLTHERYRSRALTRLGAAIDGFLTDTPSPGTIMASSAAAPDSEWTVPWTPGLWDEFQAAWGYDLREHLPELFLFPDGQHFSRVKLNFVCTIQRLLENHWLRPLREWCDGTRMILAGRLPDGASAPEQSAACPSVMRAAEFFDVPVFAGPNFATLKLVGSVARQMGRPVLDLAPSEDRAALAMCGISAAFPGSTPASREGVAKRTVEQRLDRAAADASARLHLLLGAGERVCDVAIINPIESAWAQLHPGWATSAEVRKLDHGVRQLTTWLTEAQIDFDFLDEGVLARRAAVLHGRLGLGLAKYRAVIVAGSTTLRSTTLELLRQMSVTGGTVVFVGEPPTHIDGRASSAALALATDAARIEPKHGELLRAVAPDAPPIVLATDGDQQHLLAQVRRVGDRWIVALMNTSRTDRHEHISVLLGTTGVIEEWDCATGEAIAVAAEGGSEPRWQAALDPLQLRIFVASPAASPARVPAPATAEPAEETLDLVRFESAEWQVDRESWQPACDLISLDRSLRHDAKLAQRDAVQVQPWARQESFGSTMRVKRLSLRFHFHLEALPGEPLDVVMESPGGWRLTLNGSAVRLPTKTQWHGDPSQRRVPLPLDALRVGANELVALVPFIDETDLEPFGLLGRFTVVKDGGAPKLRPR